MTTIYAIKDTITGLFLTKADDFKELTTTTRTFQSSKRAWEVIKRPQTYLWIAIGKKHRDIGGRIDINSEKFKDFLKGMKNNLILEVIPINVIEKEQPDVLR